MPKRALVIFPGTTHPVRMGSQVRTNALLRHLCEDLGWEVELLTPYGMLRRERWGENWNRLAAIHIPRVSFAFGQTGFTMPHLRKAHSGGVVEALWRDLRDNAKRLLARGATPESASFELLSHTYENDEYGGNGGSVSARLTQHEQEHYRDSLKSLLEKGNYDAVIVTYVWLSSMVDWLFDKPDRPQMICDTIDVQYVRESRLEHLRENSGLDFEAEKRIELDWLGRYDLLVGITDVDTDELHKALPETPACTVQVEAPPPGYPLNEALWHKRCSEKHEFDLVFLGGQNEGNLHAVDTLLDTIVPALLCERPDLRVAIAGSICDTAPVRRWAGHPAVKICGPVDVAGAFLERGRVMAAPITAGGGVKVKILEAMAHGLAVVTTPMGAEGIDLRDGEEGFITGDLDEFGRRVLQLLNDAESLRKFSFAAQHAILKNLNRNKVYREFDAFLKEGD